MKRLLLITAILLLAGNVQAEDGSLASRIFSPDELTLNLFNSGMNDVGKPNFKATPDVAAGGKLNPGRAMLMSAIIPGAGELYAGKKLKAAIFFTVEALAWTGVILYYNKGKSKEDEFMAFADEHFDENAYRDYEYSLAISPTWGDSQAFSGGIDDWTDREWEDKIHYLPSEGFTHELPTQNDRDNNWSDDQQYYEMIGKYIHQFGFGWDDGFGDDDGGTPYFDGSSPRSVHYMDMRHDSNQLLKTSAWGYNIALLNHVASALDASFTVRLKNRQATAELGFRQIRYDDEVVPVGGVNIHW